MGVARNAPAMCYNHKSITLRLGGPMLIRNKPCYMVRAVFHRKDYPNNISETEKTILQKHLELWDRLILEGSVMFTGPVQDPKGTYGLALIFADSEDSVRKLLETDPLQNISEYHYTPMRVTFDEKY